MFTQLMLEFMLLGVIGGLLGINDCCRGFKKDYKNNKIYPCLQARGYKFKFNKNNGS